MVPSFTLLQYSVRKFSTSSARFLRTVSEALDEIAHTFEGSNVSEPSNSASHLVAKVIGTTNIEILSNLAHQHLSTEQELRLASYVQCRLARMPVQYIVGDWDFRKLRLKMRPPVFIPRPETEELVGHVLQHLESQPTGSILNNHHPTGSILNVMEVGCGSGAICLSLLKESTLRLRVLALDQSEHACALTEDNLNWNGLNSSLLKIVQSKVCKEEDDLGLYNMIAPDSLDLIVSNPPYVLRKDVANLPDDIKVYEDLRAIDGGKHGLDVIEPLLMCASRYLKPQSCIFLEVDPCHVYLIPQMIEELNIQKLSLSRTIKDFQGVDRFLVLCKDG